MRQNTHKNRFLFLILLMTVLPLTYSFEQYAHAEPKEDFLARLKAAPARVILADGKIAGTSLTVVRQWKADICELHIKNNSNQTIQIREVVLFDFDHHLADTTPIYGEGFQKLGQMGGTIGSPQDLGTYSDRSHYKIPEPENMRTVYGLFTLQLPQNQRVLLATTSCNKFISRFSFDRNRLRISVDCENLILKPGESWNLEEFMAIEGEDREKLYDQLTARISQHHPRLKHAPVPMGWSSWYCFGPKVTANDVARNTEWIADNLPALKYIQIDDGYQPWMGDWLDAGQAFGGDVTAVLKQIQSKKLEPAIWVAPFVASPESKLFKEHPDWMVKDKQGNPLRSDKVGFGGWRLGPWYVLDGTHPAVQQYFTSLFKTMREKWGCTYFKLDANYWGAIHDGVHYDKNATRIEAYRRGMEAILKGSKDAFILGCNHPIWASLGTIHGSRSSMDTWRKWESFRDIAKENLLRGWQNGRLWWNDPDCLLLTQEGSTDIMDQAGNAVTKKNSAPSLSDEEFRFHATSIYASGGLLLSGDDLTKINPAQLAILKAIMPPSGVAAKFPDEQFEIGKTSLKNQTVYSVFNWGEEAVKRTIWLPAGKYELTNKFTGKVLGVFERSYTVESLAPHDALLITAKKL